MEFQSKVDMEMPYRLLLYQVEMWRLRGTGKKQTVEKHFPCRPLSRSCCITEAVLGRQNADSGSC
ncbi:hypothetical protein DQG23_26075 [Paenibacillus contaminans]|uniref:Uncharacterized protein n=1 Tax=Paenibacillus contaminans TaxID=450362 RepID=A0A329MCW6_9BACL|nr:hypothetical protein DQG23_26075 [Paenibacillus contaminans]